MSTALRFPLARAPLIEEVALVLYEFNATTRRDYGLSARAWEDVSELTQAHYLSMATAVVGAVGPRAFGQRTVVRSTRWSRLQAAWTRFLERNWAREYRGPGEI